MRIVPLADMKARLSSYLDSAASEGPIVITRNGKAAAVLLAPSDDDDLEGILLARSKEFQRMIARSHKSIDAGKRLSSDQFWKAAARRAAKKPSRG